MQIIHIINNWDYVYEIQQHKELSINLHITIVKKLCEEHVM